MTTDEFVIAHEKAIESKTPYVEFLKQHRLSANEFREHKATAIAGLIFIRELKDEVYTSNDYRIGLYLGAVRIKLTRNQGAELIDISPNYIQSFATRNQLPQLRKDKPTALSVKTERQPVNDSWRQHTDNCTIIYGPHKTKKLSDLPPAYLEWLATTCTELHQIKTCNFLIEVGGYSGKRIDSLSIEQLQELISDEDQSLWLNQIAQEKLLEMERAARASTYIVKEQAPVVKRNLDREQYIPDDVFRNNYLECFDKKMGLDELAEILGVPKSRVHSVIQRFKGRGEELPSLKQFTGRYKKKNA